MRKFVCCLLVVGCWFSVANAAELMPGHNSKQPIQIDADKLEVSQTNKTAVFSGSVVAVQGSMNLKADRMVVHYAEKGSSNNAIKLIEVFGNVVLTSPQESAKGTQGYYDVQKSFVRLVGNVVLTKGANIIKGNELQYDINKGQSSIVKDASNNGRVRGLFVPEGAQ